MESNFFVCCKQNIAFKILKNDLYKSICHSISYIDYQYLRVHYFETFLHSIRNIWTRMHSTINWKSIFKWWKLNLCLALRVVMFIFSYFVDGNKVWACSKLQRKSDIFCHCIKWLVKSCFLQQTIQRSDMKQWIAIIFCPKFNWHGFIVWFIFKPKLICLPPVDTQISSIRIPYARWKQPQ